MAKNNETDPRTINLIAAGTEIQGDLISSGDIRIDGSLKGNLSTKGKVIIGETGTVEGEIECANSEISGHVKGKIRVQDLLSLKSSSKIHGDIFANQLAIEPGSKFTGNCNMTGDYGTKQKPGKEEKTDK